MTGSGIPAADITVNGTGLLCVTLLLRLRTQINGADPGTVVHVIATDPAAPLDLPAWCYMTGHHYLGPVPDTGRPVYGAAPHRRRRPYPHGRTVAHGTPPLIPVADDISEDAESG
ncbi:sulfurtransferase TusA family protein [Streptomyces sp. NPDC054933]